MVDYVFTHYNKNVIKRSVLFSARFAAGFWVIYNFFFGRLLVSMAMRFVVEDIQYHAPQYGPRWYSLGLAIRLFLTALPITMFMESVHLVCQHFLTMVCSSGNEHVRAFFLDLFVDRLTQTNLFFCFFRE